MPEVMEWLETYTNWATRRKAGAPGSPERGGVWGAVEAPHDN
jgi:hypothetical protein